MADIHAWVDTAAVIIAAASFWRDANQREFTNIFTFDEKNDAFWKDLYGRDDLKRIHSDVLDLEKDPPTLVETKALVRAFVQYQTSWRAMRLVDRCELKPLSLDIADFLSRPLPRMIWEQEKKYKHPKFVKFVKRAIERNGRLSEAGDGGQAPIA
jgi:hypothetical protein